MITWRPASAEHDALSYEIFAASRLQEVRGFGWRDEEEKAFLRMQHEVQQRAYAMQFPGAEHLIVEAEGVPVGRLILLRNDNGIRIVDIALLPAYQSRGIGSELLQQLQREAAEQGRRISLHVLEGSPAIRLYERLGFRPVHSLPPYLAMEWPANDGSLPES